MKMAIQLLEQELTKFPTTLKADMDIMASKQYKSSKHYFAILYRVCKKKILHHQIYLFTILTEILKRLANNVQYSDAVKETFIEPTMNFTVILNRKMLNPYLQTIE